MKKTLIIVSLALCPLLAGAQTTAREYLDSYTRQVRNVGYSGVGVETILNKWEADFPDDGTMLEGRFNYYFAKSLTTKIEPVGGERYLGNPPAFSLPDSTGTKINYFEVHYYDEADFAEAQKAVDRAISLYPDELMYRLDKISALMDYEKDSPDLAAAELTALVDYDKSSSPAWTYDGEPVDRENFLSVVQQYCYNFYRTGTPNSYESFRAISEKMNKLYPKNTEFLSNLGTYWFVAKGNNRKALSYYTKVLKLDPGNYAAVKNCVLMARRNKDVKMEKKYLPMLIQATDSQTEKMAAQARLQALGAK